MLVLLSQVPVQCMQRDPVERLRSSPVNAPVNVGDPLISTSMIVPETLSAVIDNMSAVASATDVSDSTSELVVDEVILASPPESVKSPSVNVKSPALTTNASFPSALPVIVTAPVPRKL